MVDVDYKMWEFGLVDCTINSWSSPYYGCWDPYVAYHFPYACWVPVWRTQTPNHGLSRQLSFHAVLSCSSTFSVTLICFPIPAVSNLACCAYTLILLDVVLWSAQYRTTSHVICTRHDYKGHSLTGEQSHCHRQDLSMKFGHRKPRPFWPNQAAS